MANVSIWGERRRQLQVQVDPAKPERKQSRPAANHQHRRQRPLVFATHVPKCFDPGASGFIDTPNQRLGVRHLLPISTADEFAQVTIEGTRQALGRCGERSSRTISCSSAMPSSTMSRASCWSSKNCLGRIHRLLPAALNRRRRDAPRLGRPGNGLHSVPSRDLHRDGRGSNLQVALLIAAALLVVVLGALISGRSRDASSAALQFCCPSLLRSSCFISAVWR